MDIENYMALAEEHLQAAFPGRIVCLGLQGSYRRGEATEHSDIDLVVILDRVEPGDIDIYRSVLDRLPYRERSCGFFSGREELLAWDRGELFQFYYDTRPWQGDLEFLRPLLRPEDIRRAIHVGACGIYHGCVHNLLHTRSEEIVQGLYKSAFFLLQAKCFLERGVYCPSRAALIPRLAPDEKTLMMAPLGDLEGDSQRLMMWSREMLQRFRMD